MKKLSPKEGWDTVMNNLEKRSFYSFLGLYIFSSVLFISLIGYWYYKAQKNALEKETYYKLQHITDMKAGEIIMAHMEGRELKKSFVPDEIKLAFIDINGMIKEGLLVEPFMQRRAGYFEAKGYNVFVSNAPRKHLGISYVVAQSNRLHYELESLQHAVLKMMIIAVILMAIIAWMLSKLFMKPVRQRVQQIERFINDVTHELNTPITALSMATNQALKKQSYTKKTLTNISISTKQLYDIYSSLAYLSFSHKKELGTAIDIAEVLHKSISYYQPLCESKGIIMDVLLTKYIFTIPQTQIQLLFSNLIGNAIKYSPAGSTMILRLEEGVFSIKDQGIGIDPKKQKEIFKRFKRATEYSGGFGVGLNIVQSICDEYGIRIGLDSVLGKGTEFRLTFNY